MLDFIIAANLQNSFRVLRAPPLAKTCPAGVLIFCSLPAEHAPWLTDTILCLVRCYKAPLCSAASPTGPRECGAVIFGNVVSENKAAMWGGGCVWGANRRLRLRAFHRNRTASTRFDYGLEIIHHQKTRCSEMLLSWYQTLPGLNFLSGT